MGTKVAKFRERVHSAVNYRLRTVAGGRLASYCRPTEIAILLTERCNARCVHCDIWKNRGKESLPSVDQWKATLRDLRRWLGPVHVVFTGGEALLMPFASEVVSHACSVGLLVEHLTHGFWLDQTRIEKLAMGNPMRVTVSCDGIGATHDKIRGREHFFDTVETTIQTLLRLRQEHKLGYVIRLKTVIMEQNLHDVGEIARYAQAHGLEVWYQPIEQNYNTPEDLRWFEHSANWPKDRERAAAAVAALIELKRKGLPIANSEHQLEVMIPYFRDPEKLLILTQEHNAHEKPLCTATTMLQIQSNGDVKSCWCMDPIGNITETPIRRIWDERPRWWNAGCCLGRRMSEAERAFVGLSVMS
ncbi:MAG TPA: radical SAM protein [Isosphaeraceae bacterium]|nr:radical SAM protein [Isosphaeraceae bacterium]